MKTSLEWLTDFLPGPLVAADAAEALTHGGLPVEVIEQHGDDTVIDVEVTSNRRDCLSHVGVARELSALLRRPFKEPQLPTPQTAASGEASVRIDATDLCPHYVAFIIRNVKIGPSPAWLSRRLEAIGLRSINNVVDITNYVLFELGQPLHAFDFDKLAGKQIIVRTAKPGEALKTLDGHERKLTPQTLVIADAEKPVALAGVMGGESSEVTPATTNILLEAARFDPLSVRNTARRLALKSDSSYRFERGIDVTSPLRAGFRAAKMIAELAGGTLVPGAIEAGAMGEINKPVTVRLLRIKQLLGIEIKPADAVEALTRLGLQPTLAGDTITAIAPPWRSDINIEVDLIEEIARMIGYSQIPTNEQIQIRLVPPQHELITIDRLRETLIAAGYFEAITITFVSDSLAGDFTAAGTKLPRTDAMVRKADAQLRPSLIPGLLEALVRNASVGNRDARLYEMGSTFGTAKDEPTEIRKLAFVSSDDLRKLRGILESLLSQLDPARPLTVSPANHPGLQAGVSGSVLWANLPIGTIGQVAKSVTDKLGLRGNFFAVELDLPPLLAAAQLVPQLSPLPKYPAIERDVSFTLPENVPFERVQQHIAGLNLPDLQSITFVGVYRGKPLPAGQKSVTINLTFRSPTTTLTSEAVDASFKRVIDSAAALGATIRS